MKITKQFHSYLANFDNEDWRLLVGIKTKRKVSLIEAIRQAVRAYAESLGIK